MPSDLHCYNTWVDRRWEEKTTQTKINKWETKENTLDHINDSKGDYVVKFCGVDLR